MDVTGVYNVVTAGNQGVNFPLQECYRVINGLLLRLSRVWHEVI